MHIESENVERDFRTIRLDLRFKLGTVNCYLLKVAAGYILIDTGGTNNRNILEKKLKQAGCKPGNLKLIILSHGDFDHIGNAAYLRRKYGSKIAMHPQDFGMIEKGDMFWGRKKPNLFIRTAARLLFNLSPTDRIRPDISLHDGDDLSIYGLAAKIIHLPGHSSGSIGILTPQGDLFCGDLFENSKRPVLNSIMDDVNEAYSSVEKLHGLKARIVYPGHGNEFPLEQYLVGFQTSA